MRKYVTGDKVRLLLDRYASEHPADVYTISRELPPMNNVWQYRVKRVGDGQERAVSEQQLAKTGSQTLANSSAAEVQQIRNARAFARARVTANRSEQDKR